MKRFICQPSGSGISEDAWQLAERTGAAWVGNDAAAHITLLRNTVEQELAFGMEQDGVPAEQMRDRIAQAARQWGLTDLLHRDPSRLSTGQTRRVAIASALLRGPDALVLDCPLDGCDDAATTTLCEVIDNFPGDVTIVDRTWNALADLCEVQSGYPEGVAINPVEDQSDDDPNPAPKLSATTPQVPTLAANDPEQPTTAHHNGSQLPAEMGGVASGRKENTENQTGEHSPAAHHNTADAPSTEIQIQDLTVKRHGFTLGPLTATIAPGITHVAGPNGTGKTTLLLALADLISHSGPDFNLAYGWAPTAMDTSFSTKTVLEEVSLGSTEDHARIVLDFCGVSEFASTHPLDVPSSPRRLVSIACALVRGPSFLLLDEPTVGLDVYGYRELKRVMCGFADGQLHAALRRAGLPALGPVKAVVWTCHNAPFAEFSDHRLVL